MSLQLAAQHLAAKGRGPDSMLVHMAPQEVAGLQALARAHGGTLTTNPDTGLPEAGFLRAILPTIAGLGLSVASGGALTPLMAAGLVGGGTALATGNLRKGLMAGLGAYGGAGLAGSISAAGTAPLSSVAGQPLPPVADMGTMAAQAPVASFPGTLTGADFAGQAAGLSADAAANVSRAMFPGTLTGAEFAPQAESLSADALTNARMAQVTPTARFGAGLEALSKDPSKLFTMENAKYGLAAAAPMLMQEPKRSVYPGGGGPAYEYSFDPITGQYRSVAPGTRDRSPLTPTTPMMLAMGGPVEEMSMRNQAETFMTNGEQMYAGGGLSHLGDYSDGGRLLRGPGDGVSDDIPATIADKRPARLADGEFVVPARIVSELGNGSTEAGARKLYAMMDRVQKARNKTVGKNKVAVDTRTEKLLPA